MYIFAAFVFSVGFFAMIHVADSIKKDYVETICYSNKNETYAKGIEIPVHHYLENNTECMVKSDGTVVSKKTFDMYVYEGYTAIYVMAIVSTSVFSILLIYNILCYIDRWRKINSEKAKVYIDG